MIHPTAEVSKDAIIGNNVKIWNNVQIREYAKIGNNCILGKNVYIDCNVVIGNNVKIGNNVSIFDGVIIRDGVFIGPHVCFTNDLFPRSCNLDGSLKKESDWKKEYTEVKKDASIGANSTIRCGIVIGEYSMIGCGSVVLHDIPDGEVWAGNPARKIR